MIINNRIFSFAAFCFVLMASFLAFTACTKNKKTETDPVNNPQPISFTTITKVVKDKGCKKDVCSRVTFVLPKAPEEFNYLTRAIEKVAASAWGRTFTSAEKMAETVLDDWQEEKEEYLDEEGIYDSSVNALQIKAIPAFNNHGILGLQLSYEKKVANVAAEKNEKYVNLLVSDGSKIELLSLFKPDSKDALIALAEDAFYSHFRFRLSSELEGCQLRFDRCRFILPSYFRITPESIVFEYQQNELGPAWMGAPVIELSYMKLNELIDPAGPLRWAIQNKKKRFGSA